MESEFSFEGDRAAAETRLQRLVQMAFRDLSTEHLNTASFHLAVYLDVYDPADTTQPRRKQMMAELETERTNLAAWWDVEGQRLLESA